MLRIVFVILLFPVALAAETVEPPSPEAYGKLPEVDLVALSPSGQRLAVRQTGDDADLVVVYDVTLDQRLRIMEISDFTPRGLLFANDDKLVIVAGETNRTSWRGRPVEYTSAFLLDVDTGELRRLLDRVPGQYSRQSGLPSVVGVDESRVYLPAREIWYLSTSFAYNLIGVNLHNTGERILSDGLRHTIDWFVDADGNPLLREDYDNPDDLYQIWHLKGGTRKLFEETTPLLARRVVGVTQRRDAAYLEAVDETTDTRHYARLDFATGEISEPMLGRSDVDIRRAIADINRVVYGVEYSGFKPGYEFLDAELDARMRQIQAELSDTAARLVSWSSDFGRLVVHISGGWSSGAYLLFTRGEAEPRMVGTSRPDIPPDAVIPTQEITYTARDGLEIPALVTAMPAVREPGSAPLVVLPHGGPEASDSFEFDWLAQFIASRGYVVLQPQFRGSSGFGQAFRDAGYGEWGRKMQTDLDDGVTHLVESGLADRERVCIVGTSYGGYAALAALAFSPELYRCGVSINGIADLERFLRGQFRKSYSLKHLERYLGLKRTDTKGLRERSPMRRVDSIRAPLLLLHGENDAVVNIEQSRRLFRALKRADRPVIFEKLEGEDHWLSYSRTRVAALTSIERFLAANL